MTYVKKPDIKTLIEQHRERNKINPDAVSCGNCSYLVTEHKKDTTGSWMGVSCALGVTGFTIDGSRAKDCNQYNP